MPQKILFVDDEPQFERLILQRMRKKIREGSYELLFASDGEMALSKINDDGAIDLIVTDLNMPTMDGFTLLRRLQDVRPELKAIVISAYYDSEKIQKAKQLGALEFVTKPIQFTKLESCIDSHL